MKKLILLLILSSCMSNDVQKLNAETYDWETVTKLSKGSTVTMYMWGGSEILNKYMNEYISPVLKTQHSIILNIVPINDLKDTINKLIVEKQAGRNSGSVDVLWINGENFKLIKETEGLWGGFAHNLPIFSYIDPNTMKTDFGTSINNLEVPWGEAQFNFIYNGEGDIPFTSAQGLIDFVTNNIGRFTYPAIPDFTGSAFVRNIAIDLLGYNNITNMSDTEFETALMSVWEYFNFIKPYLWQGGENYPENFGKLDLLFQNNNVDIMMSYTLSQVTTSITRGDYPQSSKSFLLNKGTLFNNNYLSIPWNAPNKSGALYLINHLLSKEVQIQRLSPSVLGWQPTLNIQKLSSAEQLTIKNSAQGLGMVSIEEATSKRIPELTPYQLELIEQGWLTHVAGVVQ